MLPITTKQLKQQLLEGKPRIAVAGNGKQGIQLTVFMNEAGEEKVVARRIKEIFKPAQRS